MGKQGMKLAQVAQEIGDDTGVSIAVAPQYVDIKAIVEAVHVPVLAQHVDSIEPGPFTGQIPLEAVRSVGAVGTLVNHSERRLRLSEIDSVVQRARQLDLVSVVCADTASAAASASALRPDMVAIEPPELIGTGIAVSKARPEIIMQTASRIRDVNRDVAILCGAGITNGEDVSAAIRLGTNGVLVASGVVKAKDQRAALMDLANGLLRP